MPEQEPIVVAAPGERPIVVSHVVLDFNGTLPKTEICCPELPRD